MDRKNWRWPGKARSFRKLWQTAGILFLAGILYLTAHPEALDGLKRESEADGSIRPEEERDAFESGQGMTVHYLDVEKCNCVLVSSSDGHFMLIDAGSNDEEHTERIVKYLQEQGVKTLDYLLITHPHKDHIRAVPEIIDRFTVEEVLMGEFDAETVGTTTFARVTEALEEKTLQVIRPQPGETRTLGNVSFTILIHDDSEETAQEELNDCSIGLILTDGFQRFLFYGDGEERAESALLNSGFDLNCDVMMVAHHGSKSSTGQEILDAVRPQIAVISCGIDGDGEKQEPSKKVLKRLQESGVTVYRTDRDGTVVILSGEDGLRVMVENENYVGMKKAVGVVSVSRFFGLQAMSRTDKLRIQALLRPMDYSVYRVLCPYPEPPAR